MAYGLNFILWRYIMHILNLFKDKNEKKNLAKLKNVQQRISKLEKDTSLPKLEQYVSSTTIFLHGNEDALKYILDVINGNQDPTKLPQHSPFKSADPIYFWKTFAKYFYEMSEYCRYKKYKETELKILKSEEIILKEILNIK